MANLYEASNLPLSGQVEVDALLRAYVSWDFTADSVIYYTFDPAAADAATDFANVQGFGTQAQDAARLALAHAAEITGITFAETTDTDLAELHFATADLSGNSGLFTADARWEMDGGGNVAGLEADGYIFLHTAYANIVPGTFSYELLLHELGHALGLKHPHEQPMPLFPTVDNTDNTLMSYRSSGINHTEFQEYDVAALRWIYGGDGLGGAGAFRDGSPIQVGTLGDDTLVGGAGHDYLTDTAGNDTLIGNGGNDYLYGGAGSDFLDGGDGDDRYGVGTGDVLADSSGTDWVFSEVDWVVGPGFENLVLNGGFQFTGVNATGNSLGNLIAGNERDNVIAGGGGNDTLAGGFGLDRFVFAEAGAADADLITDFGDGWANELVFDATFFTAIGAAGFSSGDARFFAGAGATSGQDASDRVVFDWSTGRVFYDADGSGAAAAQLVVTLQGAPGLNAAQIDVINAEANPGMDITGTSGNDTLTSTAGDDNIDGLGGNDTINMPAAGYGDDVVNGGTGNDSLFFNFAGAMAILVDFSAGTVSGGAGSVDFSGIERVVATVGDDHLIGAAGAQNLSGVGGNDTLEGMAGNDWLWGGGGNDRFIFREFGSANADNFGDFASGTDKIVLDATVMTALGAEGNFAAGDVRFWAAAGATSGHDADDRVIYNTTTRQLFYDADGSGTGAAQLIATLQSGATLSATNIVVEGGGSSGGATEGDDVLVGTEGPDTIDGLGGNDHISGLGGNDHLIGGAGNDFLDGGAGSDLLDGGTGDDTYVVRSNGFDPADQIAADPGGIDTVIAEGVGWTLGAGLDNLIMRNPPFAGFATGNELDNTIEVEDGDPLVTVNGLGGNDTLLGSVENETFEFTGSYGNDFVDGGGSPGVELPDYIVAGSDSAIVVDFAAGTITGGGPGGTGGVSFVNVHSVRGGDFDDRFTAGAVAVNAFGNGGNDVAIGGDGDDLLNGGGGNDELTGGGGNDVLIGDVGMDRFIFDQAPGAAHADTIFDFFSGQDAVVLDLAAMPGLGSPGQFSAGDDRFHAAAGAMGGADDEDRVIYDTIRGEILYDADGNGLGVARLVATLHGAPMLSATDIVVVGDAAPGGATEGDDVLVGTEGPDTIDGLGGNDQISGLGGDDHLIGGSGNDTLDGGAGVDTLEGGAGDDSYVVDFQDTYSDSGGVDTVFAMGSHSLLVGSGVENLVLDSTSTWLIGDGNELDNVITNESGIFADGYLDGEGGNDTLIGGTYYIFTGPGGDYGHDFVDGAGRDGMLFVGEFSAAVVDFRNGTVVGGGEGGTGSIDFVDIRRVRGGDFGDQFFAADSGSIALGGAGDDTFVGGAAADIFHDENPWYYDGPSPDTIGTGDDQLFGGGGDDHLTATRGSNTVDAGDGNDIVRIGIGDYFDESYTFNDVIDGGAGIDMLTISNLSAVTVDLGAGTLTGGGAGGTGMASLASIENFEAYQFGNFANRITGSSAANLLAGGAGDDWIAGRAGWDTLTGGAGLDTFAFAEFGSGMNDAITDFASGEDTIQLDGTAFTAIGASGSFSAGDGRFWAAPGATAGHDADDRVIYDTSTGILYYDADGSGAGGEERIAILDGAPTLAAADIEVVNGTSGGTPGEHIVGTSGNDTLNGTAGDDTFEGLGGNDTFNMTPADGYGNDVVDGGTGNDSLFFNFAGATSLTVDFGTGMASNSAGSVAFSNVERVVATVGNDHLIGAAGAQNLSGVGGNDIVEGRGGNDWLWSGGGLDSFVFREFGAANADRIGDFASGSDTIALDNAVMTALGADGDFSAGDARFRAAAGATGGADANDRVIYNTSTGQLYYDADGSGAGAAQLIATLSSAPGVSATDIAVI